MTAVLDKDAKRRSFLLLSFVSFAFLCFTANQEMIAGVVTAAPNDK